MDNKKKEALSVSEQNSVMKAVYNLIKECPFIRKMEVNFDYLDLETDNIAVLSTPGAFIDSKNILGGFRAVLPFILCYRANRNSDGRKLEMVELLNGIGKWLARERVELPDGEYRLDKYPSLSDRRIINRIEQQTVPYISEIDENSNITYICTINVTYEKEAD